MAGRTGQAGGNRSMKLFRKLVFAASACAFLAASFAVNAAQTAPAAPMSGRPAPGTDIPADFKRPDVGGDYIERSVMITMRDGVKLKTFIVMSKGTANAPMIFTRTPYNAAARVHRNESASLLARVQQSDEDFIGAGFIRVYQDVRGKYGSEGTYEMDRPPLGPLNATGTDNTTDAWDTIDWLVKNVPESNGNVGMIGSSYGGFTAAAALLDPHPALKAVVPECPALDLWMGDDIFHYGAFRQPIFDYMMTQTGQKGAGGAVPRAGYDDYENFLNAGSAADFATANGLDQLPYWGKILAHPNYDAFWQEQAFDKLLAKRAPTVPTLWVGGLWDQEDIYGPSAAFAALKAAGRADNNWIVLGPWSHSQQSLEGRDLGPLRWNGDTSRQYRRDIVVPFFEEHLRGGKATGLARATIYNPAENRWERFDDWPSACPNGCKTKLTPLYLGDGFSLSFDKPAGAAGGSDSYVSDPAKPVPHLPRPVRFEDGKTWRTWLIQDQRYVDGRTDVLTYQTPPLTKAMKIEGAAIAEIVAKTTGTDGDFVVRLIDVYPSEYPNQPELGGYQLPVATDIFRGRFRNSFEHPTAIPANKAQTYRFALPPQNYTFLPGHRIRVQIQSTLFPLYDRNPQSFVANVQKAKPGDYRKATVSIMRAGADASAIWLPLVPAR
jgi:putative CocE/NonD family hydrolase